MDKKAYQLKKMADRKTGYPMATIAYYGPDDRFASKVVVGILLSEKDKQANEIKRWFATDEDVRKDVTILREMIEYLEAHPAVRRVAMVDRIIGCPHESGIDYPEGQPCPQCPFWANRDRWTGELLPSETA